jgi:tetratricopeptide (TPR) repeat protein
MKLLRIYTIAVILNITVFSLIYFFFPESRWKFVPEDQFIENLSTVLFFSVFLFGTVSLLKFRDKTYRLAFFIIPLISLAGFLDELSFGRRIFYFTAPEIYGLKVDTLHGIFLVIYEVSKNISSLLLYPALLALFATVALIAVKYRKFLSRLPEKLRGNPPFMYVLIATGLLVIALPIDVVEVEFYPGFALSFIEELLEMNVALTLLFASFAMEQKRQLVMNDKRFFFLKGNWRAVGIVFVITISFLLYHNLLMIHIKAKQVDIMNSLFEDGMKHLKGQRFDLALEKADEIDNIQRVVGSMYIRFLVNKSRGRDEEAVRYAKEIFSYVPPKNVPLKDVHETLISYYLRKNMKKEAETLFKQTLALWPDDRRLQSVFMKEFSYLPRGISPRSR